MRPGLRTFTFLCGLIAAALCVAVLRPGLIRDAAQATELRPFAFVLAAILLVGGLRAMVQRGDSAARGALTPCRLTLVFLIGVLLFAMPIIDNKSTKDLAIAATRGREARATRCTTTTAFFHDFTYYSGGVVGLVHYTDELELQFLDPAERAARFIDDADFREAVGRAGPGLRRGADPGRRGALRRTRPSTTISWPPGPTTIFSATSLEDLLSGPRISPAMPSPAAATPPKPAEPVPALHAAVDRRRDRWPAWPRCCAPGGSPRGPR